MAGTGMLLAGCATIKSVYFNPDFKKFRSEYISGNYAQAINTIMPENVPTYNRSAFGNKAIIIGMEAGVTALTDEKFEESTKYLDIADESSSGIFSFSSYEPKFYDKIMINTYKGIAFWAQGNTENAKTEFNRLHTKQTEAVEEHKKEIVKAEEDATKSENVEQLSSTKKILDKEYTEYKNFKPYADFTNPFSTYISALFNLTSGYNKSDVENAINYMKRVKTMVSNQYIASDIKMAEDIANGKDSSSNIWIIYEEGVAPEIEEKHIKIPFPTKSGLKMANLTLPHFISQNHSYNSLKISTSSGSASTETLADMERVIKTEYQKRYPAEVTKAVIWMVANIAAQEATSQLINNSSFGKKLDKSMGKHGGVLGDLGKNKLASKAVSSAASVAISEVLTYPLNTTSWSTLPKEIQMAKISMPADKKVKITASNGQKIADVEIAKDVKNAIIYVRSPSLAAKAKWFVINM